MAIDPKLYLLVFVIAFDFIISIAILMRGIRNRINALYGFLSFGLVVWGLAILGFYFIKLQPASMRIWTVITHSSAAFLALIFFYFALNFPKSLYRSEGKKKYLWLLPIVPFFVIVQQLFSTNQIIGQTNGFVYEIKFGYLFFTLYMLAYFFAGYIFIVLQYLRGEDKEIKKQVLYVFIGTVFSSSLALITDLVFPYYNVFQFTWLGPVFTFIMIGAIAYAILRHNLFNLKVIVTELLIYAIWIFLVARFVLADSFNSRVIEGVLLIAMIILGTLLIKSVRREVEQRIKLEALTKDLEAANEKLKELDKLKSQFLSFASHQVKAPMNVVKGYATLIYDGTYGPASDKIKDTAIKIKESADRMIALVNNIMDLRKIEEGKMEYKFEEANIGDLVTDVVGEFKMLAENKGLHLEFAKPEKILMSNVDIQKVRQSIQNLVENAIKYTDTGWIKVEVSDFKYNEILITVTDTGHGISKELQEHLFDQYQRDSATASKIEGTGLGLFIAKQIIEANHGQIWAESDGTGKGSKFCIKLPRSLT